MPHVLIKRRTIYRRFQPNLLAGLSFWLDAADIPTITLDGSGNASQVVDKSPRKLTVTQTTAANMPGFVAGDGLTFTSANHELTNATSLNFSSGASLFVAYRPTDVASYATTGGGENFLLVGGWRLKDTAFNTWGTYYWDRSGTVSQITDMSEVVKIGDRVYSLVADATNSRSRIIGGTTRNYTASAYLSGTASTVGIGSFPRGNMVIREAIAYNRAISESERIQVESYLTRKWGTG